MIGNLFLAIGIACVSACAVSTDNFNRIDNEVTYNSKSYVTGQDCMLYRSYTGSMKYVSALQDNHYFEVDIDSNGYVDTFSFDDNLNIISSYDHLFADFGDVDNISIFAQKQGNFLYYRVLLNTYTYSYIQNVEIGFSPNNSFTQNNLVYQLFYGNSASNPIITADGVYERIHQSGQYEPNWLLLTDVTGYQAITSTSNVPSSFQDVKFAEYLIKVPYASNIDYDFTFRFLGDVTGQYSNGYNDGYAAGVKDGEEKGYWTGYAAARDYYSNAANGNVRSLFGVLADTPIRFLKQMFNFELFGMNVAVVILSCLTAIVIFSLIKKIWK